jgi:hypothetical protein
MQWKPAQAPLSACSKVSVTMLERARNQVARIGITLTHLQGTRIYTREIAQHYYQVKRKETTQLSYLQYQMAAVSFLSHWNKE